MKTDTGISTLSIAMDRYASRAELTAMFSPAPAWTGADAGAKARAERIARARADFWVFDELYFPPSAYAGAYAKPNAFHHNIVDACEQIGKRATLIAGPNGVAKSVTIYKYDIYAALFGMRRLIVYCSETLETPHAILTALPLFIRDNQRIMQDFPELKFFSENVDYLHIRTNQNPRGTVFRAVSEDRSARGMTANITSRPDLIHVEDFENRTSSMTPAAVGERWNKIVEYRNALAQHGCMTITANNFDERCLANRIITMHAAGDLDDGFDVQVYPAWGLYYDARGRFHSAQDGTVEGPLWREMHPVATEAELRARIASSDDADWAGQQQRPKKPAGLFFKSAHLAVYSALPAQLIGCTYVDPNLAKKGKGDKTCMGATVYSFETQSWFGYGIRYRSYSDPNDLLGDLRELWQSMRMSGIDLIAAGMDGNVNQESNWSAHLSNYCRIHDVMLPPIHYKKYNVEWISKNAQLIWASDKYRLPAAFEFIEEEQAFYDDMWAFTGRKIPGAADDAPDWFCSVLQFMMELGIGIYDGAPVRSPGVWNRHNLGRMRTGRL